MKTQFEPQCGYIRDICYSDCPPSVRSRGKRQSVETMRSPRGNDRAESIDPKTLLLAWLTWLAQDT